MTQADIPSDSLYRAVIGEPNQEFYLSYFRRADSRGYAPISWHWPVFVIEFSGPGVAPRDSALMTR